MGKIKTLGGWFMAFGLAWVATFAAGFYGFTEPADKELRQLFLLAAAFLGFGTFLCAGMLGVMCLIVLARWMVRGERAERTPRGAGLP